MKKDFAEYLIKEGERNYDIIALDYARTRRYNSQDLIELAKLARPGEKVLDLGCANGRMFELFAPNSVEYWGADISRNLIEIAKKQYPAGHFEVADVLNLPFPDNTFDKVYFISVLHHIPSGEFRQKCFEEIERVMKPGGKMILRVWDLLRINKGRKLLLKYTVLKLIGRTKVDFFDLMMPWNDFKRAQKGERFFHLFRSGELEKLAKRSGMNPEKAWRGGKDNLANIYLIAEKTRQ